MNAKPGAYIIDENGIRPDENDPAMAERMKQTKPSAIKKKPKKRR